MFCIIKISEFVKTSFNKLSSIWQTNTTSADLRDISRKCAEILKKDAKNLQIRNIWNDVLIIL